MRIAKNKKNRLLLTHLTLGMCLALFGCSSDVNQPELSTSSLSAAPGADDEPIAEAGEFNTASNFSVVREPGPRLPEEDELGEWTDADFETGLPEAVLQVPTGVDISINRPPFFEGLENQDVLAGDIVEIVYRPQDPDGELPGMYPEKLPQGATFTDNLNGSKTFTWQPLQKNVGVSRFTVTAIDPENSEYRASQSLFIRVALPDNPANIPNVAPTLDPWDSHYVRAGDPVVIELKGIDLNGSVPTIEIPDMPAGGSLNQDPRFEEIYVLKFVPSEEGVISIDVLVRDSVDTSLSTTESVSLTVLARDALDRTTPSLRNLAASRSIKIGYASLQSFYHRPDGAIYEETAAREFDIVTPENSMKMEHINPESGRYQFAATDNLVSFARQNDMVVHGHPLVWYRQLPEWITSSAVADRESHMTDFIKRIMGRYQDDISIWDVVNEPISDDGTGLRDSIWLEAMGESYIDIALQSARDVSPTATLLINEFDISMNGAKFDSLMALVDRLQARDVPLDGIGFQMHLFQSYDEFETLRSHFAEVAERGLDIYITELDVSLSDGATPEGQADSYQQIMAICLEQPRCQAVQLWGFTDQYSFREIYAPLLFDKAYQPKPAYEALLNALQ